MTIPLTGSGSLSARLGPVFRGAADALALVGGTPTSTVASGANLAARIISTIQAVYAAGTAAPQVVADELPALTSIQSATQSLLTTLQGDSKATLQFMYGIDQLGLSGNAPLSSFQSVSLGKAIQTLISQMTAASATVQAPAVSVGALTAVGTPVGNPVVVVSTKNGQGSPLALCFPETLTLTCTADAQTGGAVAGNEKLQLVGQPAVTNLLSPLWPGGSGTSVGFAAIDGSKSSSTGNLLTNSDFQTYSNANYPDNFVITPGTAGTQVLNGGSANAYTSGGGSLQIVGDGSTLTALTQTFNTTPSTGQGAGGTPANLAIYPDNVLHLNLWLKMSATPAAGQVVFELVDGSNSLISDDQGTACQITKSLTTVSTSFVNVSGAFRLPLSVPSTVKLRVRLGVAIDNGKSLFVGRMSLALARISSIVPPSGIGSAVQGIYPGGIFLTVHSGNTAMRAGLSPDTWTLAVTNNYSTSGSGLFQQFFERFFQMRNLGLQLPTAASLPTIADTVIA